MDKKTVSLKDIYPVMEEKLKNGGTVELPITGTSMNPLLYMGRDTVLIKKDSEYKIGDIIFYRRDDGHFVLHRIIGENNDGFILCGDNQIIKEYGITPKHIIAKVILINRNGKEITPQNKKYNKYKAFWLHNLPIRRYVLFIVRRLAK